MKKRGGKEHSYRQVADDTNMARYIHVMKNTTCHVRARLFTRGKITPCRFREHVFYRGELQCVSGFAHANHARQGSLEWWLSGCFCL